MGEKSLATFSISLARRSSLTSRSGGLMRSPSSVPTPIAHATVDFITLDPLQKHLGRATDHRCNRFNGRPHRRVFATLLANQGNHMPLDFRGKICSASRLRHYCLKCRCLDKIRCSPVHPAPPQAIRIASVVNRFLLF